MRDRASVNSVAMATLKLLYPSLLDVGCFSHTLDRVGEHFKVPVAGFRSFLESPKQGSLGDRMVGELCQHILRPDGGASGR